MIDKKFAEKILKGLNFWINPENLKQSGKRKVVYGNLEVVSGFFDFRKLKKGYHELASGVTEKTPGYVLVYGS